MAPPRHPAVRRVRGRWRRRTASTPMADRTHHPTAMSWLKKVGKAKGGHAEPAAPLAPLNARLRDWAGELRDETKSAEGFLDQLTLPGQVSALAYEPGIGLLAVGR